MSSIIEKVYHVSQQGVLKNMDIEDMCVGVLVAATIACGSGLLYVGFKLITWSAS